MEPKPEYVSLRIIPVPGGAPLPPRIAQVLAQVVKRRPSELADILKTKSIKLNKVLLNRDLKALIAALKKTGFQVSIMPYGEQKRSPDGASFSEEERARGQGLGRSKESRAATSTARGGSGRTMRHR